MRAGLDRIEADLRRLEASGRTGSGPERPRPDRYYEVLVGVYEHGRHGIDRESLAALAARHGYDRRGLNGYFTGSRAALMRRGDRVVLTAEGQRLVDLHLRKVAS